MRNLTKIVLLLASSTAHSATISAGARYEETYTISWQNGAASPDYRLRLFFETTDGDEPSLTSLGCRAAHGTASIEDVGVPGTYFINLSYYGSGLAGSCKYKLTFTPDEPHRSGDVHVYDHNRTSFGETLYDHTTRVCSATVPDTIKFPDSTPGKPVPMILKTSGLTEKNYITYTSSSMDSDGVLALTNEGSGHLYVKLTETDAIDNGKWVTSPTRPELHLNLTSSETSPAGEYTGTITATMNCE